ncbi:PAS domain-containing protein [Nisaea sediminum]|uniref:PAS domain-containing protein n=1 Tax=Nisaea sediminum TaxID=2775867 RepID=UPI001867A3EB|nr:PAS domain-containing protein [Nisaea sediminum]
MKTSRDGAPLRLPASSVIRSEADLAHPELRALYSFWKDRAGDRRAPSRNDFDVLELKQWLPHLQLLDVLDDLSDVRYRVIGTWIAEFYGKDDTGKTFAEIGLNEQRRRVLSEFLTAAASMTPQAVTRPFYGQNEVKEHLLAERIILPLTTDGRRCDKLLSGIYTLAKNP